MDDKWVKVIDKAEFLLREYGWRQGLIGASEGKFCLGAALQTASKDVGVEWMNTLSRTNRILGFRGRNVNDLVDWNDNPGRQEKEVFEILEALRNGD